MQITILLLMASFSAEVSWNNPPWRSIRNALGQVETGNVDRAIGRHGEVSRFQILPKVWRQYSRSRNWKDDDAAWTVAKRILSDRITAMRRASDQPLTMQGVYLLWNAPSTYASNGFKTNKLHFVLRDRAERFANASK